MVFVNSTARRSPAERDVVQLSTASAFNICDGLFRMANCLITELPAAELRDVRYALDTLLMKVDRLLDPGEDNLSLDFDNRHYPGGEDFGAGVASTSTATASIRSQPTSPSRYRRNTVRIPVPVTAPTPTPTPDPTPILVPKHGDFPLVLSSRDNVGFPDYTHHPLFVRPGVPGSYQHPPTASRLTNHAGYYYVVSKGLYVGIFTDWDEVSPWVTSIPGSLHHKAKTWEEARDTYNARLAAGVIQILS